MGNRTLPQIKSLLEETNIWSIDSSKFLPKILDLMDELMVRHANQGGYDANSVAERLALQYGIDKDELLAAYDERKYGPPLQPSSSMGEETIVEGIFNMNYEDALKALIKMVTKNKESSGSKFSIEYLADKTARQFKGVKTPKLISMYHKENK